MQYVPLAFAVIVGVIGCATPTPRFIPYTEMVDAPSETVLVLHAMPRDRRYVELGEVSVRVGVSNGETHVMAMRDVARQIGANAIVLVSERVSALFVNRGRAMPTREAVAIAIRYTRGSVRGSDGDS